MSDDFDAAAFKAVCAALDIEAQVVVDSFGRTDVRIDRDGLNKLIAAGLLPENPSGPAWEEAVRRRREEGSA